MSGWRNGTGIVWIDWNHEWINEWLKKEAQWSQSGCGNKARIESDMRLGE